MGDGLVLSVAFGAILLGVPAWTLLPGDRRRSVRATWGVLFVSGLLLALLGLEWTTDPETQCIERIDYSATLDRASRTLLPPQVLCDFTLDDQSDQVAIYSREDQVALGVVVGSLALSTTALISAHRRTIASRRWSPSAQGTPSGARPVRRPPHDE